MGSRKQPFGYRMTLERDHDPAGGSGAGTVLSSKLQHGEPRWVS
ncbi:MAG: hypothetical protein ACLU3I_16580 [Acutalibacteraceae bacterium]